MPHGPYNERVVVETPGEPVPIDAHANLCLQVDLVALPSNTGRVAVGSASVRASDADLNAVYLTAGDAYTLHECDLAEWFIDAEYAGEGVVYTAQEG
jgi:hypothetical protein